jgi:hypothetical protein
LHVEFIPAGDLQEYAKMRVKVVAVTLALSLPSFLWPPKPARAATVDIAPAMPEPAFTVMAY